MPEAIRSLACGEASCPARTSSQNFRRFSGVRFRSSAASQRLFDPGLQKCDDRLLVLPQQKLHGGTHLREQLGIRSHGRNPGADLARDFPGFQQPLGNLFAEYMADLRLVGRNHPLLPKSERKQPQPVEAGPFIRLEQHLDRNEIGQESDRRRGHDRKNPERKPAGAAPAGRGLHDDHKDRQPADSREKQ